MSNNRKMGLWEALDDFFAPPPPAVTDLSWQIELEALEVVFGSRGVPGNSEFIASQLVSGCAQSPWLIQRQGAKLAFRQR